MESKPEILILAGLLKNDVFLRKVLPFLKAEYFTDAAEKSVFGCVVDFFDKYNAVPSKDAIEICLSQKRGVSEEIYSQAKSLLDVISEYEWSSQQEDWTIDLAETFCKDKALYLAILESISIINDESDLSKESLPSLLQDALSVTFDSSVGHDYIEDAERRYDFYHKKEKRIPFDLDFFNRITSGGTPPKTLNVILAGTGVGKSLFMCHHASNCLAQGKNVLYITCEMAEERIAERIDANLMDTTMDELRQMPKMVYDKKISRLKSSISGKLIVKEYPTATANVNHMRALLDELNTKRDFKPDVIFVDYLNICAAARFKYGANVNSYMYVKAIAEELRGLAVEQDLPIFTATQTNRTGFNSSDVGLEDTSESFGLPATADFMFALISNEELDEADQIMVKQLKNRYNDPVSNRKFIVGINRAKMKLQDVVKSEQDDLIDANQTDRSYTETVATESPFSDWKIS